MVANPQVYIDSIIIYLREALAEGREATASPAMNAWAAATQWEAEWLQDFEELSAEDILASCPKPAPSHICESCGGDLRYGEHEVRVDVDVWRCFEGGHICGFRVR